MELHPLYGPIVPERNWAPAPSFLLRRNRVLRMMEQEPEGKLLEIGCGGGTLLYELGKMGFSCGALETSQTALETATYVNRESALIYQAPQAEWQGGFDYLMALEVLEHIQNDEQALGLWRSWLKPGAMLVLSVPAHQRMWTEADVWAGHYRRYEQAGLRKLLQNTGFTIEGFETWGFPLSNLLLSWRAKVQAHDLDRRGEAASDRKLNNDHSGVDRETARRLYPLLDSFIGKLVMRAAFGLQHLTVTRDWGIGYLVKARRAGR